MQATSLSKDNGSTAALSDTTAPSVTYDQVVAMFRRGPERRLDVGHSRLAYYRVGRGPDVLFVHGWPLSSATFRAITPALARHFTCHFIDLPGTGHSESNPDAPFGVLEHAATLKRAVDVLGLADFSIVAHDSGGGIARFFAADDQRVRGLVLGNTELPNHTPKLVAFYAAAARVPFAAHLLRLSMSMPIVRRSALGFGGCFQNLDILNGDFHELLVAPILASPRAFAGQMRLIEAMDFNVFHKLPEVHARIHVPVRLIWGSDDPFFPLEKARGMVGQFGGKTELQVIEGGKLFVHEDRAPEFAASALEFLTGING